MKTAMTQCERHEDLLDYLYDEMPAQQAVAFSQHLDTCAACVNELQSMRRLRTDLRAWDVVSAPQMDIVIPRSPWEALKECFALFPAWGRGAFALSAAAAMLFMAFGLYGLVREVNDTTPKQALAVNPLPAPLSPQPVALTPELKAQVEAQVAAAVAKAVEQERQALRAQLAGFEARNAEQQIRVQTVARQLRDLQTRHDALLAEQQPSLRRMMADYNEPTNER